MTNDRTITPSISLPSEQVERIAQLALVGQAALNTNLTDPHVGEAVGTLLQVMAEISDDLVQALQEQQS